MRTVLLLLASVAALPAQNVLQGHVVDSVTGLPVRGASIEAYQGMGVPVPITDAAGYFRIPITRNPNFVVVQRSGYLQRNQPLPYNTQALPSDLRVPLTPEAVIAGKVEDQDGVPVLRASVGAYYYSYYKGVRKFERSRGAWTDERGQYRIANLPAGRYYLLVNPAGHPSWRLPSTLTTWDGRYTPRYYPATIDFSHAEVIEVKAGEQHAGADFHLTRIEGVTVSGHAILPPGAAHNLWLDSADTLGFSAAATWLPSDAFTFSHVPPGTYILHTLPPDTQPRIGVPTAEQPIEVGSSDISGIAVAPVPLEPIEVSGKVTFRENFKPEIVRVQLTTYNPFSFSAEATSEVDGSFAVKGLLPGHYDIQVRSTRGSGWFDGGGTTVSALLGEREVLPTGFDVGFASPGTLLVTLASPVAQVSGKLLDSAGRPAWGARLALVPVQQGAQLTYFTDINGDFKASLLNTGDYHLYIEPSADLAFPSYDPDYLKAHANDYPVIRVFPGENLPLALKLRAK